MRVLNLLAAHPDEAFTLSEIVRRLGLSKGTAHTLLRGLTGAGYLTRHAETKAFRLGPALVGVGKAAQRGVPMLAAASEVMTSLTRELGLMCSAVTARDANVVVVDVTAPDADASPPVRAGQTVPFAPPFGETFVAWAPEGEIDAWLARGRGATPARTSRWRAVIAFARARGYTVQRVSDAGIRLGLLLSELAEELPSDRARAALDQLTTELDHHGYIEDELRGDHPLPVTLLSAPVFDDHGRVGLGIAIWPRRELTPAHIADYGQRLVAAAETISAMTRGREANTKAEAFA